MSNDRLKFRVWNDFHKTYDKIYVIDCDGKHYVRTPASAALDLLEPGNETFNIIEQCTGLKDKNGNLIYAGDVVKVPDDWDEYGMMAGETREVYYKDGGFRLKPREFDINRGARGHWLEDDGIFEIIGNVHTEEQKQ